MSRPVLSVDPHHPSPIASSSRSPRSSTPQSAIIEVPPGWGSGSTSSRQRTSMERDPASSASSSSFDADASPYVNYVKNNSDPFDNTTSFAEDPFRSNSGSSDDDSSSRHDSFDSADADGGQHNFPDGRRGSVIFVPHRSITDPLETYPIDPELAANQPEFDFSAPPAFNRTYSAPLPTGGLQHPLSPSLSPANGYNAHPCRTPLAPIRPSISPHTSSRTATSSELVTPLDSISLEFADNLQTAIQTLLHLSPPHLLDNAKEQYSGCTIQVPTTSLSALFSSMRSLNYLSANVRSLCVDALSADEGIMAPRKSEDFDIGELLQSVADLLSGQAAQAGVDFVLFHGDVGIKHISVSGDGDGLAYTLGHVIRQILAVARPTDTIELGLQVIPQSPSMTPRISLPLTASEVDRHRNPPARPSSPGRTLPSPPSGQGDGPLLCVFEIVHNIGQTPESAAETPRAELNPFSRLKEESEAINPRLDNLFCKRLLKKQNASLKLDAQPSSPMGSGLPRRAYELSVLLPRGRPIVEPAVLSTEQEAVRQPIAGLRLAREPTLSELSDFAESLRGRKVTLHASLVSVFARHLTSYLAAWGLDISHIPIEEGAECATMLDKLRLDSGYAGSTTTEPSRDDKFVIIDDDINVLRRELIRVRAEAPVLSLKPRLLKRPTLAGRTRSTPHIRQVSGPRQTGPTIIHFTSLAKYNQVRDVIASLLGGPFSTTGGTLSHPEVMVVPKPVGPRRFLTALHTAVNQPVVDPFFSPIATSPRSPGGGYFPVRTPLSSELEQGYFEPTEEERPTSESSGSQKARSPLGEFPPAQASVVRTEHGLHLALPTPGEIFATPASEYFSSASKSSGSASAVVMQSPDGRPVGMFFEPPTGRRASYSRNVSDKRKVAMSRRSSGAEEDVQTPHSRRPSSNESLSRRASVKDNAGVLARAASRRKTLPASGNPAEPILAVGRDRASTLTRRRVAGSSPVVPKEKDFSSVFAPPKNKRTSMTELDDIERIPPIIPTKKNKEDVVVPPINVLIVEDNPINQNILSMFLRKKKINHQTAKDGLEAVEKWRTGAFHLILMDIQLPVMDGIEATKEIRQLELSNNIGVYPSTPMSEQAQPVSFASKTEPVVDPSSPVRSSVIIVALTASSLHTDRVAALAAGCNDFLTKPVSLKWLERKIVEWGCMQALIDYEGWKRRKASDKGGVKSKDKGKSKDAKEGATETKQGFQYGPQAAAKNIAERLFIERKNARSSGAVSPGPTSVTRLPPPMSPSDPTMGPSINIRAPTPRANSDNDDIRPSDRHTPSSSPTPPTPSSFNPAASLQSARVSLADKLPPGITSPRSPRSASEGTLSKSSSLTSINEVSESPFRGVKSLPVLGDEEGLGLGLSAGAAGRDKPLPSVPDVD